MVPENDHTRQIREDPRSTDELILLALTETDENAAWKPVMILHFRATSEVLAKAQGLCESADARERRLGADILGQLGIPERAFADECFGILAGMLSSESDPDVFSAVAVAFGHLHDSRAIRLLAPLIGHPDSDVRLGIVHGLSQHEDPVAIAALIELSRDAVDEVRDWATFGLGSMISTDTPEIREALFARVSDSYDDARCEALVGLAKRKDGKVLGPLINELASQSIGLMALEAAEELGDPCLRPALLQLKEEWRLDGGPHIEQLNRALASCSPNATS
jgi:HEAT repeat protein